MSGAFQGCTLCIRVPSKALIKGTFPFPPFQILLCRNGSDERQASVRSPHNQHHGDCSIWGGVANLVITAVGAGMLALPKAYASVGLLMGIAITMGASILTYLSCSVIVRYCALQGSNSYGALVKARFGWKSSSLLQCSVIVHVSGVMIIYLIIIADMLVGSAPSWGGLLVYLLDRAPPPWWLSRSVVVGCLLLFLVFPMLLARNLTIVSKFSRFSMGLLLLLASTLILLSGVSVAKMKSADVHILPDVEAMGGVYNLLSTLVTVLAVNALAFTMQFNLIPVHNSLRDNRVHCMLKASGLALFLCVLMYSSVGLAGYILFGTDTEGDVLKNLTVDFVASLIDRKAALAVLVFIVVAYTINLLCNFVLKVWAVREAVSELCFHHPARQLSKTAFYGFAFSSVLISYAISLLIPSVWFLVSLVGSTACVIFSYVFPGLLILQRGKMFDKVLGGSFLMLAFIMATTAVVTTLNGNGGA